ncbi:protein of unknown function [Dyadobacter soli]|uniref:DUF4919 domain-containing protein n=1 Tax=Dyadobacter soli TaxID=659014 RepID=A0A1G7PLG4_9BACT|nr:DUF4919 domain-containing protein [Dyadobacter soli]SDF86210.1 protein of unknown function [Dyadobacter soli]
MLRFRLFTVLLFIAQLSFGQQLDLLKIKAAVTDSSNAYYYPKLLAEFLQEPDYYSGEKGTYLYYGYLFSSQYKSILYGKEVDKFDKYLDSKRYPKAIEAGEKLLENNAVNLGLLMKMTHCYKEAGKLKEADNARKRVGVLMRAIRDNGDKPYRVTSVGDEYIVMAAEGLTAIARGPGSMSEESGKIPRTEVQGIKGMVDSWEVKDERTNEKKAAFFEVLYNTSSFKIP